MLSCFLRRCLAVLLEAFFIAKMFPGSGTLPRASIDPKTDDEVGMQDFAHLTKVFTERVVSMELG